jgi:hypothetical protein
MRLSVIAFITDAENLQSFSVAPDAVFCALQGVETFVMLMNDGLSGAYFLVRRR